MFIVRSPFVLSHKGTIISSFVYCHVVLGNLKSAKSFQVSCIYQKKVVPLHPLMEIQEKIVAAATERMRLVGIRSVSIDDLCRELGISKKTFYVYFDTKESLVDAMLHRHEQHIVDEMNKRTQGKHIIDMVLNTLHLLQGARDIREVPPLVYDLKKYYPQQLHDHLSRLKEINRDFAARYLTQGVQEGFLRADINIEVTARVMASLHQVLMDKMAEAQRHPSIVSDAKVAINIFFRGLISEEGQQQLEERLKIKV